MNALLPVGGRAVVLPVSMAGMRDGELIETFASLRSCINERQETRGGATTVEARQSRTRFSHRSPTNQLGGAADGDGRGGRKAEGVREGDFTRGAEVQQARLIRTRRARAVSAVDCDKSPHTACALVSQPQQTGSVRTK